MNLILKKLVLIVLAIFFASSALTRAQAGVGHGGGGDVVAQDFALVAQDAINAISTVRPLIVHGFEINGSKLQFNLPRTKVHSVNGPLLVKGKRVIAINYPSKLEIVIDRDSWLALDSDQKMQIAIHEFLGLTFPEISDESYVYSRELHDLVLSMRKSLKVHVSLLAKNPGNETDYGVVGDSIDWVEKQTATEPGNMSGFSVEYSRSNSFLIIALKSPDNKLIYQNKVQISGIEFTSTIAYPMDFEGKHYQELELTCEEPLGPTP